jgi:uncharacterized membrane protein
MALVFAVILISLIGRMARHYIGRKMIETVDSALLRVPVMNKIYGTIKQINDALTSSNKTSFKQVVLIEYPRPGIYTIGFLTGAQPAEVKTRLNQTLLSVFVPTTPNPTGGFVLLVPEEQVLRLDMSVTEGVKYILSLGSITPDYGLRPLPAGAAGPDNSAPAKTLPAGSPL